MNISTIRLKEIRSINDRPLCASYVNGSLCVNAIAVSASGNLGEDISLLARIPCPSYSEIDEDALFAQLAQVKPL